jgi:hypothetical protein
MTSRYIPSDKDHAWFFNNHEKMDIEKESDIRLIKYYHLAVSAVAFSFMDYQGDKDWQQEQIKILTQINKSLQAQK